jgi:hypothetical protein
MKNRTLLIIWFAGMAIAGSLTAITLLVTVALNRNPVGVWEGRPLSSGRLVLIVYEDGTAIRKKEGTDDDEGMKLKWDLNGPIFTLQKGFSNDEEEIYTLEKDCLKPGPGVARYIWGGWYREGYKGVRWYY